MSKANQKLIILVIQALLLGFLAICGLVVAVNYLHSEEHYQQAFFNNPLTPPIENFEKDSQTNCSPQTIQNVDVPPLPIVPFAGSTTFAPLNNPEIIATIQKARPQFPLRYVDPAEFNEAPGSGTGIKWLIRGTHNLSFAQSSRPINDTEFRDARDRGLQLKQEPIAYDVIAIFVNPQLIEQKGLQGLTLAQVRDIFTGKITNWKEVASSANWKNEVAPELTITPFRRNSLDSGTVEFFKESVMNKLKFGPNVNQVGQRGEPEEQITTLAIRKVASTLGSISFATASEVIKQDGIRILPIAKEDNSRSVSPCADKDCKVVNTNVIAKQSYPTKLARKIYVVIKQDGDLDQKAGEAYAKMLRSCEGQKWIKQAGFVPLTPSD